MDSKTTTAQNQVKAASKLSVTNAVTLDPHNPIPLEYNSQTFVTRRGARYLPFLNPDDRFAQLLLEAKQLSPTTLSCINNKVRYCVGKGWFLKNVEKDEKLTIWAKTLNRKSESLNDILKQIFDARFTWGNAFINVVRGQVGSTKFIKVYVRSFLDCRLALPDDDDICTSVFYSKEFRKYQYWTLREEKAIEIPIWTPNSLDNPWYKDDKGNEHTMFHIKNEMSGYDYYGMPSNMSTLPQQILEYKSARYNMDNFENNLVLGGIIVLKGAMTTEEAQKVGKKIVSQHTGDGKRGKFAILSSEGGMDEGVQIEQFENAKEGSYIEMDKHVEDKIISGNDWNRQLNGMHQDSGLGSGGSGYLRAIFDQVNNDVIIPEQEYIIEKFLKPLLQIADEWMGTNYSQHDISLKAVMPVSFLGDIDVNSIITKDEGRELIGKEPLADGKGKDLIKDNSKAMSLFNNDPKAGGNNV